MQRLLIILLFFFQCNLLSAQTSLQEIDLDYGDYPVGYKHFIGVDKSRTYNRVNDYTNAMEPRPVPISIWFPAGEVDGLQSMTVLNYFESLKVEEEWEHLPNEQLLNWFYYTNTPQNQAHLKESVKAYAAPKAASGQYPVVLYAASFLASSVENFAMCEMLASHGYIVLAISSRGAENRWFTGNKQKDIENQARDIEFILTQATSVPGADLSNIALMGYSYGGLPNVVVQNRNSNIKAVVSLDGTERYQYPLLQELPYFDQDKLNVPYLHMAQKDIPQEVLEKDKIDPILNTIFQLYDSLENSTAYKLKLQDLTHSYFSTMGVLFQQRDARQDKSDDKIMASYKWLSTYALNFLNAHLKDNPEALAFMQNTPEQNGALAGLITYESKVGQSPPFTFRNFNDMAAAQEYMNLSELYDKTKSKHPALQLPEGNMNAVGLQLTFDPSTSEQGIRMLEFATQVYPESANLFDSLAEAYLYLGNTAKAKENFQKSLDLYPENTNATNRLKELE